MKIAEQMIIIQPKDRFSLQSQKQQVEEFLKIGRKKSPLKNNKTNCINKDYVCIKIIYQLTWLQLTSLISLLDLQLIYLLQLRAICMVILIGPINYFYKVQYERENWLKSFRISHQLSQKSSSLEIQKYYHHHKNQTPYKMINLRLYFDCGTLQKVPSPQINSGEGMVFSVISKGGLMGVKGVIVYQIEGNDFVVFFENPFTGGNWHGAQVYGSPLRSAYDRYVQIPPRQADHYHEGRNDHWRARSLIGGGNNAYLETSCHAHC